MCIQLEGDSPDSSGPKRITSNRRIGDRLCIAGEGPRNADIMFVSTSIQDEEAMETVQTVHGAAIPSKARFLKGPVGAMFRDLVLGVGIDIDEYCFYTALCRWLLPKNKRSRPDKADINWSKEMLYSEIREVQPKLIVCIGKPVFDLLSGGLKLSQGDIEGGFFDCPEFGCMLYLLPDLYNLRVKPEKYEAFRTHMLQVRRAWDDLRGKDTQRVPENYRVVETAAQLQGLVAEWQANNYGMFSVDCEWGGTQVVDCQLRSVQFCWAPGEAAYIKFRDETTKYTMDVSYEEAGRILGQHLNRQEVKYIGHHLSVDLTAIAYWLKLDWYGKGFLDTEFAEQVCDEYAQLGLDRLSMKYTDKGRYDVELMLWKKANKLDPDAGYGTIPDRILIPYACRDVDVVMQAMPRIMQKLLQQDLWKYYQEIFNPFVTDVFTNFSLVGLPMDIPKMDHLREMFTFARDKMNIRFQKIIAEEAEQLMLGYLQKLFGPDTGLIMMRQVKLYVDAGDHQEGFNFLKDVCGIREIPTFEPIFYHYVDAPRFNIRATEQMRRWLFKVKGYTPVKSTNNKEKGLPSTDWSRILTYPPDRQKEFTPSVDKQTLQILSEQHSDQVLFRLLELNAVGNLCKAFLKEPDIDEETGEVTRENGLHFWVASDLRVHGQMSTTETGRPRSWKPNSLNWPSYVNERIMAGIKLLFEELLLSGELPEKYHMYVVGDKPKPIPSIRSVVKPPPGWVLVESDYQTAEIRGLAFVSGDANMIRLVTEPDPSFGIWSGNKKSLVRLYYDESTGIKPEHRADEFLFAVQKEKKGPWVKISPSELVRKADGSLKHPKNDLHWSLAEMVHGKPREMLHEKRDRGAAKVGNFSSAYGATPATLERKIEADTGIKPEPGTGQRLLDALAKRQPDADAYLKRIETVPKHPGFIRAASGRLRRFIGHPDHILGFTGRERESVFNTAGREARNFEMQESVAATAAIAGTRILEMAIKQNLQGRPITILYDSVVTMCPLEERFIFTKAHTLYMHVSNGWAYHNRVLTYPIDNELNVGWSDRPSVDELKLLEDTTYHPTPEHLKPLEQWLDQTIAFYQEHPETAVHNKKDLVTLAATVAY